MPDIKFGKQAAREMWVKSLQFHWDNPMVPRLYTRVGEIYEVEFGENIGDEFSGTHFAICLADTMPAQNTVLVIPITTKWETYNGDELDRIYVKTTDGFEIFGGVARFSPMWISKKRIHRKSCIMGEEEPTSYVKAKIAVTKKQLKRWKELA